MIRFWVLVALSIKAVAGQFGYIEQTTVQPSIKGQLSKGCHDCYPCSDPRIRSTSLPYKKLTITDKDNMVNDVCCIHQKLLQVRNGESCGQNPAHFEEPIKINGKKQKRKTARSILFGEYPWRAFIYLKHGNQKAFCAGTAIDSQVRYILTAASCVGKYRPDMLAVSFTRSLDKAVEVRKVVIHEDYNENRPFVNDIALLLLDNSSEDVPWAMSACLSDIPPLHATSCVVMSDEDYFVDTIVTKPTKCETDKSEVDISQMYSVMFTDDYKPEMGAGLFCQDKLRTGIDDYYASGITLQIRGDQIIYTNVSHFEAWIRDKTPYSEF